MASKSQAATAAAPTTPVDPTNMEFADQLSEYLRSGYQILYVPTSEESRVENEIAKLAKRLSKVFMVWDHFEGLQVPEYKPEVAAKYVDPTAALKHILEPNFVHKDAIIVLRDMDDFFGPPVVRRILRSAAEGNRLVNDAVKRTLIIVSPKLEIHPKLRSCITVVDFALPNEQKLGEVVHFLRRSLEKSDPAKAACTDELKESVITALLGLTSSEAENALSRCLVRHSGFVPEMLRTIKDEKAGIIRKSEVLTYVDEATIANRDEIGGFDNLLEFIARKRLAYSKQARVLNIDYPKGITLLGVPGTGKSVVAAAISKLLGLPLYIMDVGAVFGSLVGESESRMRDALRQITAQAGCVLLIDEADKAWGNAHESRGDSGVTQRIFGQLLSWLAAKKDRTFVVMTMNRTKGIPPEFLRAGRFDAVFYTDMPNEQERRQILEIHFRKRSVDTTNLFTDAEWGHIVEKTAEFVGAELEEVVKESRSIAFENRGVGNPTLAEVLIALAGVVPLSKLDAEGMEAIRTFVKDRAKPVSRPQVRARAGRAHRGISMDQPSN